MTGKEHYAEAELCLERAAEGDYSDRWIELAKVHAQLAMVYYQRSPRP